jgi:hypothetical protein
MWEMVRQNAPLTGTMKAHRQHEGHQFSHETLEGEIVTQKFRAVEARFEISARLSPQETQEQMNRKIKEAAESIAHQSERMFFTTLDEVTRETGNVLDARGAPFHPRMVLDLMEKMPLDFDKDGKPILPTIVLHPDMLKKIEAKIPEWEGDPEFKRRQAQIIERKKEEWRDRESNRKLVG